MAAFGNLNNITIGIGMLARPFIKGMKAVMRITKDVMKGVAKNLKKTAQAFKKTSKASNSKDSIFSPGWFKKRARWFIQLRLFWSIWQGLVTAVRGAFEFEKEMASVQAITQATSKQFEQLRQKALEVGVTTIFSASEAAKGMVVMSQAGLSVDEVLTSIINVANLATATLYDFEKTASLVVTIMRAWGLEASDTTAITDTLATSINKTKLNMDSLVAGFNYVAGIAPQMNLTLEQTTALLGTLANRGLSASTAATSLRAVMAALLNPTDKFKRVLKDVSLTVQDVDPRFHDMSTILLKLRDAGFGVGHAFKAFRRRAAAGAAIMISAAGEVQQLSEGMNEVGRAAQMAAIQLNTVEGQSKQFNDTMIALADGVFKDLEPAITLVISLFKTLMSDAMALLGPLAKAVGWFAKLAGLTRTFITRGAGGIDTEATVKELTELNAELKVTKDKLLDIKNAWFKFQTAVRDIEQQTDAALTLDAQGKETDNLKKALSIAIMRKVITEKQKDIIMEGKNMEEKVMRLNVIITGERERQLRVMAREQHILKEGARLTQASITRLAIDEVQKKAALVEASEYILRVKERELKLTEHLVRVGHKQLSVDELRVKTKREGRAIDKAGKQYNKDLKEMFRVVRASGGEAKKLIEVMGPKWANSIRAMLTSPNWTSFEATLDQINKSGADAVNVSQEMTEEFKKGHEVVGKLPGLLDKTSKQRIEELKNLKGLAEMGIKLLKQEKKRLQALTYTPKIGKEILEIDKQTAAIKNKIVGYDKAIEREAIEVSKVKMETLNLQYKINAADLTAVANAKTKKDLAYALAVIQRQLKIDLALQKHLNEIEELRGNKELDRIKSAQKLINIQKASAEITLILQESLPEDKRNTDKIAAAHLIIQEATYQTAINLEKQKQNQDAIARKMVERRANELDVQSIKEAFHTKGGIIDTLLESGEGGLQDAIRDITTLWSAQREEANKLEADLAGLNREYQQAMSEGNIQRAEELKTQMSGLRNQIDSLNNPLKNLANTFKRFASIVIEELQKVIIKMLIVKFIGMMLGMFTATPSGFGGSGIMGSADSIAGYFPKAGGGILPGGTFGNFRKFARGGVTSGAGMALLGDNASGKELVIPSENIKDDSVSGTLRDSGQPINIINVLTDQDIASAMAKAPGQRTIINTIGKDIGKRGPTYRAIKA